MTESKQAPLTTMQSWTIDTEQVGTRLDRFLVSQLAGLSRSTIQQMITTEAVQVNNTASKPGYTLRLHDEIHVQRMEEAPTRPTITPLDVPLDIVYEDADLLVVNKPVGLVVHPAPGHHDDTLVNALVARYPELQATEENKRPGIVHRLDRDTSGLLLVAKNVRTQAALIEQMKQQKIEKRYQALVEGVVSLDVGSIDAPIGRDPRHRQLMTIISAGGREARTRFRVLERYAYHTLLLVELETGRTHQIRVHLKAINHPVVGDPFYGSGRKRSGIKLQHQFLHAYQLRFTHPVNGKLLELEAPLPGKLQSILNTPDLL